MLKEELIQLKDFVAVYQKRALQELAQQETILVHKIEQSVKSD